MITVESIQKVFDELDRIFTQKGIIIERNIDGMPKNEQDSQALNELYEKEKPFLKNIYEQVPQLYDSIVSANSEFPYSRSDFERDCRTNIRAAFETIKNIINKQVQ